MEKDEEEEEEEEEEESNSFNYVRHTQSELSSTHHMQGARWVQLPVFKNWILSSSVFLVQLMSVCLAHAINILQFLVCTLHCKETAAFTISLTA